MAKIFYYVFMCIFHICLGINKKVNTFLGFKQSLQSYLYLRVKWALYVHI